MESSGDDKAAILAVDRTRIPSLDLLKLMAVSAVVGIHAPDVVTHRTLVWELLNQLFRFGVPCFFLVSGFLFMRSWLCATQKAAVLIRYSRRLLVPFVFWALFYATVPPFILDDPASAPTPIRQHLWAIVRYPHAFLLTGFVYHLWFLSSLGQGLLVLWLCLRFANLALALAVGGMFYGLALLAEPYAFTPIGLHTHFYMRNGPFFSTLFVALGAWLASSGYKPSRWVAVAILCLGLALHFSEIFFLYFRHGQSLRSHDFVCGTVPYAVGVMLLMLASPSLGTSSGLGRLGAYSLGIYAIHPYIIQVLKLALTSVPVLGFSGLFESLVLALSAFIAFSLSKLKWTRMLVR